MAESVASGGASFTQRCAASALAMASSVPSLSTRARVAASSGVSKMLSAGTASSTGAGARGDRCAALPAGWLLYECECTETVPFHTKNTCGAKQRRVGARRARSVTRAAQPRLVR